MKTFNTLLKTELKLSIRDMNMVIFAIILPMIILVILGMIYGSRPAFAGAGYSFIEQSFGAVCTIAICAGGLMGLPILVSDYRERKILKRFKVTPVSAGMILFVHLVIYAIYAVVSLVLLWVTAVLFLHFQIHGSVTIFLISWLLILVSMLSIGMLVGGVAKNSKSASLIASILYFPMLIFSGATLPYEVMPKALQTIADIMPLTQGIKLLKAAALGQPFDSVLVPIISMLVITIVATILSVLLFRWE